MSAYDTLILSESGLVTYLPLNETSGTAATDSKSALNYTYTGTFTLNQAGLLPAYQSDPSVLFANGYLTRATAVSLHPGDVFTYEFWVKRTSIGGGVTSMAFTDPAANEHNLQFNPADKLLIRKDSVADVFLTTASFTDTTAAHHVVFTKNGATVAIYYDGVSQAGTNSGNQTMVASTAAPVLLAGAAGAGPILGNVAKVAMYNVALTAAQVLNHFNAAQRVPARSTIFPLLPQ